MKKSFDKIYFIGIGGIGVSALAKYYLSKGRKIYGSDLVSSEITDALSRLGAEIIIGQGKSQGLPAGIKLVIFSPAVAKDNPELKKAKKLKIKCLSYPQALGELTKKYFTIAIAGTHGKSTSTAMLGLLLLKAGFDPTVIVGTKLKEFNDSNCRVGKSNYLVIEADEHFASFLNYWPKIIVLTTIEKDHLDYYKNLRNILKSYKEYVSHLPRNGILIANKDDANIAKIVKQGIKRKEKYVNDTFSTIVENVSYYSFSQKEAEKLRKILKIPGEHNVSNALAVLAAARALKIPDEISFEALSEYRGSWRRFDERQGKIGGREVKIINDYGHHPTEIRATVLAAREKYPKEKIWLVFQPHQCQRTYYLFKDFVKALKEAPVEKLIITDIYEVAGREEKGIKNKVNAEKLVKAINKNFAVYLPKEKIPDYLKNSLQAGQVLMIMGAGDIYELNLKL